MSITKAAVTGATTSSASEVLLDVYPEGLPTKYIVEYGTSTAYGHTTTSTDVAENVGTQSEAVPLNELVPCTTYHYQAIAENEANEGAASLGGDRTFQTDGCIPEVVRYPTISYERDDGPAYYSASNEDTFSGEYMHYVASDVVYVSLEGEGVWAGNPTSYSVQIVYCPGDTSETNVPNVACIPYPALKNCASGDITSPIFFLEVAEGPACVVINDGYCAQGEYSAKCVTTQDMVPGCSAELGGTYCFAEGVDLFTGIRWQEVLECPETGPSECVTDEKYYSAKSSNDVFRAYVTASNGNGSSSVYSRPVYPFFPQ